VDSNQNNQKEIANQKRESVLIMEPIVDPNQEVQVVVESQESNQNLDPHLANQNAEPRLANQNQNQLVAANQEQAQEVDQNPDQQIEDQNQVPRAANPNQAPAVNGNNAGQQVDAEARIPYGVVTIHSDRPVPTNDNYAEVRNVGMSSEPSIDEPEDLTYDRVIDDSTTNENGYSTVVRDQITGGRPKRNNMYESVDEVLNGDRQVPNE